MSDKYNLDKTLGDWVHDKSDDTFIGPRPTDDQHLAKLKVEISRAQAAGLRFCPVYLSEYINCLPNKTYSIIVAYTKKSRGIGCNGKLPWAPIKEDMDHFRFRTIGQTVIMGRKTWSSLPSTSRPLSGRTNIVVSRTLTAEEAKGAIVCKSFEEALKAVPDDTEAWVIGGAQLYEEAIKLGRWKVLWATEVDQDVKCDTFFPEIKSTDRAEVVRAYSTLREDVTFVAYQSLKTMPDVTGFKLLIATSACVPGNRLQLGSERGIYDPVVYAKSLGAPVTVTARHVLSHHRLMEECKDTPVDKTTIIRVDDVRADRESISVNVTHVEDKVLQLWKTGGREAVCNEYGEVDVELRTKFKDH